MAYSNGVTNGVDTGPITYAEAESPLYSSGSDSPATPLSPPPSGFSNRPEYRRYVEYVTSNQRNSCLLYEEWIKNRMIATERLQGTIRVAEERGKEDTTNFLTEILNSEIPLFSPCRVIEIADEAYFDMVPRRPEPIVLSRRVPRRATVQDADPVLPPLDSPGAQRDPTINASKNSLMIVELPRFPSLEWDCHPEVLKIAGDEQLSDEQKKSRLDFIGRCSVIVVGQFPDHSPCPTPDEMENTRPNCKSTSMWCKLSGCGHYICCQCALLYTMKNQISELEGLYCICPLCQE